jgi:hypothetical protein
MTSAIVPEPIVPGPEEVIPVMSLQTRKALISLVSEQPTRKAIVKARQIE